jgi:hypothetical protein
VFVWGGRPRPPVRAEPNRSQYNTIHKALHASHNHCTRRRRIFCLLSRSARVLHAGASYDEAIANIKDAIRLHLEDHQADHEELTEEKSVSLPTVEAPDAPIGSSLVGETRVEHRDSGMLDRQDSENGTVDRMVLHGPISGTEFYEQQPRERRVYALAKNAAQLRFQLVPLASLPELSL